MQHQLSADDGFQSLQTDAVILNSSSGSHTETLFFFCGGVRRMLRSGIYSTTLLHLLHTQSDMDGPRASGGEMCV